MSASEWVLVEPQLARLRAFYAAAVSAVAVAPVAAEARTGLQTSLKQVQKTLVRLSSTGDLGKGLAAGTVTVERWVSIANAQGDALSQVFATIGQENVVGRFWSEVVVPTATDVGTGVKQAALGTGIGFGAVLAIALLVWVTRR